MDIYELAQAQRERVLANDKATRDALIQAYAAADKNLQKRCAALLDLIERRRTAGEDVSRSWLQKEARYNALIDQVHERIKTLAGLTASETTKAARVNLESGKRDALALISAASGRAVVAGAVDRLNTKASDNIVAYLAPDAPLGRLLARITDEMPADAVKAAKDALIIGVTTGQNPRVVARSFRDTTGASLTRSLTIVRTEQMRAYRQASLQTYAESDAISGWQWLCTKSARTCVACLAQDGRVYEKSAQFMAHVRCRCTTVPVLGAPRPRETGEEWLRAQNAETQDKVMGPAAATAWRKNEVMLSDFVGVRQNREYGASVFHDSLKAARERAAIRTKTGTIKTGNDGSNEANDATSRPLGVAAKPYVFVGGEARRLELEALAQKELDAIAPLVSDAVGLKSNWSGRVIVDALNSSRGTKPFECDIKMSASVMESSERGRTYTHEMLHAHSVGYNENDFNAGMGWEEGVVEQLQRLIRKRVMDGLPDEMRVALTMPEGSMVERNHLYNIYIAALEDVRVALDADADAETFYRDLLAQPIGGRSAHLLVQRVMKQSGERREVAKQAYMKASGTMKRNMNHEELGNPLGIKDEVEQASRKLFGEK